jgi:hypothetical protein
MNKIEFEHNGFLQLSWEGTESSFYGELRVEELSLTAIERITKIAWREENENGIPKRPKYKISIERIG